MLTLQMSKNMNKNIGKYSESLKVCFNLSIYWFDDKSSLNTSTIASGGTLLILSKTLAFVLELETECYATFTSNERSRSLQV